MVFGLIRCYSLSPSLALLTFFTTTTTTTTTTNNNNNNWKENAPEMTSRVLHAIIVHRFSLVPPGGSGSIVCVRLGLLGNSFTDPGSSGLGKVGPK